MREQNFGIAGGKPWSVDAPEPGLTIEEHIAKGVFPVLRTRAEKFPGGESVDDLAKRAERVVRKVILPHVWAAARDETREAHIAVVSHGLFISEVIAALVKLDVGSGGKAGSYRGLKNTGWARVVVDVKAGLF